MELFTPANETTVMKLCDVTIQHVGGNLVGPDNADISETSFPIELEAKTADSYDVCRMYRVLVGNP